MSSLHTLLCKTCNKKTKVVLYCIILRVIPLGLALLQVLPSEFGEYLNVFFNDVVVVVLILFYFIIEIFLNIVNSFFRKKVYLLNYFSIAAHVFPNLFIKICPLFGQILITCLNCFTTSFSLSRYTEKMRWGRGWCCNFCMKTSELISGDFGFSLEKQQLKTSKLADNN